MMGTCWRHEDCNGECNPNALEHENDRLRAENERLRAENERLEEDERVSRGYAHDMERAEAEARAEVERLTVDAGLTEIRERHARELLASSGAALADRDVEIFRLTSDKGSDGVEIARLLHRVADLTADLTRVERERDEARADHNEHADCSRAMVADRDALRARLDAVEAECANLSAVDVSQPPGIPPWSNRHRIGLRDAAESIRRASRGAAAPQQTGEKHLAAAGTYAPTTTGHGSEGER